MTKKSMKMRPLLANIQFKSTHYLAGKPLLFQGHEHVSIGPRHHQAIKPLRLRFTGRFPGYIGVAGVRCVPPSVYGFLFYHSVCTDIVLTFVTYTFSLIIIFALAPVIGPMSTVLQTSVLLVTPVLTILCAAVRASVHAPTKADTGTATRIVNISRLGRLIKN
jgi:hypothetical protein